MSIRTLKTFAPREKRVLLRVDFNVHFDAEGRITDDLRLRAVLPTIRYLLERHNAIILISHLGRPGGKRKPEFSLARLLPTLKRYLAQDILFLDDCRGPRVTAAVQALEPGKILLLENVRFYPEEEADDPGFAK